MHNVTAWVAIILGWAGVGLIVLCLRDVIAELRRIAAELRRLR